MLAECVLVVLHIVCPLLAWCCCSALPAKSQVFNHLHMPASYIPVVQDNYTVRALPSVWPYACFGSTLCDSRHCSVSRAPLSTSSTHSLQVGNKTFHMHMTGVERLP